jgi:hypothetical protein
MSCPRCALRKQFRIPSKKGFHTSPRHSRLGAFTYAQEWQTGTYHFNKAHGKTLPVAAQRTDELLTNWMTQQKKRAGAESSTLYNQLLRNAIAAQRRKTDALLVSKSSAKDYGDRVEVTAFVYDGVEAAEIEAEKRRKERMGVKPDEGGNKQGPARRRRGPVRPGMGGGGAQRDQVYTVRSTAGRSAVMRRLPLGQGRGPATS